MLADGCLQDEDGDDEQPAFVNLFARLAQAKGNCGSSGPTPPGPRPPTTNTGRNQRPKGGAGGAAKRRGGGERADPSSGQKGDDYDDIDEDDIPLDKVCNSPQLNKKARQGQTPNEDGVAGGPPKDPKASRINKQHQFVVDDDDEMPQEDKTTVDRFAKLIEDFKDLQGPTTGEDGVFNQWVKDCLGHELDYWIANLRMCLDWMFLI